MEKIIAQTHPSTENPTTNRSTKSTIAPLITNRKSPSVIIVMGKVKKVMMGLINMLIIPRANPAIMAIKKLLTYTPDNSQEAK